MNYNINWANFLVHESYLNKAAFFFFFKEKEATLNASGQMVMN